jgi:hypothetical protein
MFIKSIKNLAIAVTAMTALSAQAATVTLNGTIVTCEGLCASLSAAGNSVTATYDDTLANAPTISIQGNFGAVLGFIGTSYASVTPTIDLPTPNGLVTIPTPASGVGFVSGFNGTTGVDIGTNANQISVFGIGETSGAPIWGIFDLVNNSFTSYLFTSDGNPNVEGAQPAILPLASGTVSAVPVPAAGWLLLSALGGLVGFKRFQKNN